jgi:aspartate/tyrosine/aromatic aminotransferase
MSFFNDVELLPDDPILGLPLLFAADPHPQKVNLGIGAYKNGEGQPHVLNAVRQAEVLLLQKNLNHEYLPIDGNPDFIKSGLELLFGRENPLLTSGELYGAHTVGGSGALRIGGEFLADLLGKALYLSQPSWSNHTQLFKKSGLTLGNYPYYDPATGSLDFKEMCKAIHKMDTGSIVLLHGCCHNPTGVDPTPDQWRELSKIMKEKKLFPFFDIAYQGFGQDLDQDAYAIRHFAKEGHEMLVAYSFSKNFALYGERVGMLMIRSTKPESIPAIASQIKYLIRCNYSNPPVHGSRIISTILQSPELLEEWKKEVETMCARIKEMRQSLVASLQLKGHGNFTPLLKQTGLFSFMGLNTDQVMKLRKEKGIYMPTNGRINIAGLNHKNLEYTAEAITSVL